MSPIAPAAQARPEPSLGNGRNIFALLSAFIACSVLLAAIPYCPTYAEGKITLLQMFIGTFWEDLKNQCAGLLHMFLGIFAGTPSAPKTSLSGEATASEWTYCGLVPIIVAWLVWQLWPKLRRTPLRGETAGYALLGLGFALYIAGFLMENYYIGMGALEFVYGGLIVLFLGWAWMRMLLFPCAFLMFMWPYNFLEDVALELRLEMSSLSHHVLGWIGVPNLLHGTAVVSMPTALHSFAIDIADPCSGIRSLFALVMVACIYAFVAFREFWQKAVIVALAVPLVILGNLVRIVLLTLATIHFGELFALGTNDQPSWFHEGAGYLVYLINLGGLLLTGFLLTRYTASQEAHAHV